MSKELFDAVQMLAQEKGIPEDYLYEKISAAIVVAAKHDYNGKDIVHCDIDPEKQRFKVYVTKNVVEEVEDPDTDLTLEEAQAIKKSAKVGKTIDIPLKTKEFGSPHSLAGFKLATITTFLPIRSSGLYQGAMPLTI